MVKRRTFLYRYVALLLYKTFTIPELFDFVDIQVYMHKSLYSYSTNALELPVYHVIQILMSVRVIMSVIKDVLMTSEGFTVSAELAIN